MAHLEGNGSAGTSDWIAALYEAVRGDSLAEFPAPDPTSVSHDKFQAVQNCLAQLEQLRRAREQSRGSKGDADALGVVRAEEADRELADGESADGLVLPKRIGRFEIVRELGRGGQGIVFLAFDPALRRQVALKVPRPEVLATPALRRRFIREAHTAARLKHANIVGIYEIGDDGPVCYIAWDYCAGGSLAAYLRQEQQRIAPRIAARLIAELADGVHYAHDCGVLHRDIKPSNILLAPRVTSGKASEADEFAFAPVLTDFGLARLAEHSDDRTKTGTLLGTPAYMAPEQAEGRIADLNATTDVYGLGLVLYEVLAGRPPFRGVSDTDTLRQVLFEQIPPLNRLRPDVPADLDSICRCCLEREQRRRYRSAELLASDLRRFLRGEPTLVRPLGPVERLAKWARRRPWIAATAAISVAAVFTLVTVLSWSNLRLSQAYREVVEHEKAARASALQARQRAYASDMRLMDDTWSALTPRLADTILDEYRPRAGEPDLRGFDWWFYWHGFHTETPSQVIGQHTGGVTAAAMSLAGEVAATGGADGVIRLWNMPAGQLLQELAGHQGAVNCLAFSSDGALLVSAGEDHTVRVWNVSQGECVWVLKGHTDWVAAVLFLPDGKQVVSGAADRAIIVWDAESGEELGRLSGHTDTVRSLAYHARKGTLFSSSEDATIRAWDVNRLAVSDLVASEGLKNPLAPDWIRQLSMELGGHGLDGAYFGEAVIHWNLRSGRFGKVYSLHKVEAAARCLATGGAASDSELIVGLANGTILRTHSGHIDKRSHRLLGHSDSVEALALTPDGEALVSGSAAGDVRLWPRMDQKHAIRRVPWPYPNARIAISPSAKLVAISDAEAIHVLAFDDTRELHRLPLAGNELAALVFGPNEQSVVTLSVDEVRSIHLDGTSWTLPLNDDVMATGIALDRYDGTLAVFGKAGVTVVDLVQRKIVSHLPHPSPVTGVVFRSPREIVTSCDDGVIRVWDRTRFHITRNYPVEAGGLTDICLSPDNQRLAVRGYRQIVIVNLDDGTTMASIPNYLEAGDVEFLAKGTTLLGMNNSDRNRLWNTTNWQPTGRLMDLESFEQFSVAADGYRLAAVSENELLLIDATPVERESQHVSSP